MLKKTLSLHRIGAANFSQVVDNAKHMETAATGTVPYRGPRLLLCDDSPVERMALGHYLRRAGYEVDEAGDGQTAISQLQNREVDAVLLDLQMPGMNGFDVLSYLQKHRKGLPVVLLSGMPLDQIQQEIHGLPSRELPPLFLKPIDLDQPMQALD